MSKVLLLYSSVYGHTCRIGQRIRERLERSGDTVDLVALGENGPDPADYDKIVIGASIRNGKHNPKIHAFIREHQAVLEQRSSAFFSVNLVARKPEKSTPQTNPYVKKFLEQSPWQPDLVDVFAGDIDYRKYGVFERNMIRLIMWLTKGPTHRNTQQVFTDWEQVDRFAGRVAALDV